MPDREKVKKALEMCIEDIECNDCPYEEECFAANDEPYAVPMMRDALELLKEQEERIKTLENQLETITKWRANAGAFD